MFAVTGSRYSLPTTEGHFITPKTAEIPQIAPVLLSMEEQLKLDTLLLNQWEWENFVKKKEESDRQAELLKATNKFTINESDDENDEENGDNDLNEEEKHYYESTTTTTTFTKYDEFSSNFHNSSSHHEAIEYYLRNHFNNLIPSMNQANHCSVSYETFHSNQNSSFHPFAAHLKNDNSISYNKTIGNHQRKGRKVVSLKSIKQPNMAIVSATYYYKAMLVLLQRLNNHSLHQLEEKTIPKRNKSN